ncbi:MAG: FHA domain-containing protein [Planctomycetes bacterium]|nr:FHA domain-containing protein [Planctomycetota bacterium]
MAKAAQLRDNIDKTRFVVLRRENIIGRAPECNIPVQNPSVSRHHARIAAAPGTTSFFIEDVSARGTYVNFRRIQGRHPLKEGDRICVLRFHNIHPNELANMDAKQLHDCCDDSRVESIKAAADFTFGYVDVDETRPLKQDVAQKEAPKGLLAKLKALLRGK